MVRLNRKVRASSLPTVASGIKRQHEAMRLWLLLLFPLLLATYSGYVWLYPLSIAIAPPLRAQSGPPKNIILFIGDGMGIEHVKAASLYAYGEEGRLTMHTAPYQALMSTVDIEGGVTDSAAAGSAMATGRKVANGVISMTGGSAYQAMETSLEHLAKRCKWTGLIATSYINHATPAVFAAHNQTRTDLEGIAQEMFTRTRPNLLFGGTAAGIDAQMAASNGYTVVTDRQSLQKIDMDNVEYVSGQFAEGHMAYEYDYLIGATDFYDSAPRLSEMTAQALNILGKHDHGFFLMVEGGRIDHAGHENHIRRAVLETLEFDRAIESALSWAGSRNDTLIIVTADHETGGLAVKRNLGAGEFPDVSWSTGGHTSDLVPVYAWGPHGDLVVGELDNTDIFRITTFNSGPVPATCDATLPETGLDLHPNERQEVPEKILTSQPTPVPSPTSTRRPTATPSPTAKPTAMPSFDIRVSNYPRGWISPSGEIEYVIGFRVGANSLKDVVLYSQVPTGVKVVADSLHASHYEAEFRPPQGLNGTVEWRVGNLGAFSQGSVSYRVRRWGVEDGQEDALTISKTGPTHAQINRPFDYYITIVNRSAVDVTDVFIVDNLPFGATYVRGAHTAPIDGQISWWLEKLTPNEMHQVSYTVVAQNTLMSSSFRAYNSAGMVVESHQPVLTIINGEPLPPEGDGVVILNDGVSASWRQKGNEKSTRAASVSNPTFELYLPFSSQ